MPTKLIVQFTGMVTFVPQQGNPKKLFALLPWTGIGSPNKVHQHRPYLMYDRKHRPVSSHPSPHPHSHHTRELIPLGKMHVSFENVSGTGDHITPPAEAMDLKLLTGFALDPGQLSANPTEAVYAQVVLPGASEELVTGKPAKWVFREKPGETERKLTHQIFWIRTLSGTTAEIKYRFLGSNTWKTLMLSANQNEDILVEIAHLPSKLDDHKLSKDEPALHFDAYYDLYTIPIVDDERYVPVPE
jgi:hypothetical protein